MLRKPPGVFITGTDTGVGKTYVAALLARELTAAGKKVGVYKPVASGCRKEKSRLVSDDAVALWEAAGKQGDFKRVCPQCFAAPLAPHLAARAEGQRVDAELLRSGVDYWRKRSDFVIVEGAGGLMSPITEDEYVADLALDLGYPLVVVAANRIGVINQTLQTLIVAETFRGGLPIAGVILNDVSPDDVASHGGDPSRTANRVELAARCIPPILGSVGWKSAVFDAPVEWLKIAAAERGRE